MAYATNSEVITSMGGNAVVAKYTSDSGSSPTASTVTEAVAKGDGEIDGYLAKRYSTPIDTSAYPDSAAFLRGISVVFATRNIQLLRDAVSPAIVRAYDKWIAWLREDPIVPSDSILPGSTSQTEAVFDFQTRVSGRANMERI